MIVFKCPECGERMEIGSQMAASKIECIACREMIRVPDASDPAAFTEKPKAQRSKRAKPPRAKRRRSRSLVGDDDSLSDQEWWLYGAVFLFIPAAGVWVSSILYYLWRERLPSKAGQINQLGWIIFLCVHVPLFLLSCLCGFLARQR